MAILESLNSRFQTNSYKLTVSMNNTLFVHTFNDPEKKTYKEIVRSIEERMWKVLVIGGRKKKGTHVD